MVTPKERKAFMLAGIVIEKGKKEKEVHSLQFTVDSERVSLYSARQIMEHRGAACCAPTEHSFFSYGPGMPVSDENPFADSGRDSSRPLFPASRQSTRLSTVFHCELSTVH
jgi:hypothetical protein